MSAIKDGTGNGFLAEVDSDNKLSTTAITKTRIAEISDKTGEGFIIATDFVSLTTTGSFNGVLYIKNTSDKDLFFKTIRVCSSASGSIQVKLLRNPTAGTVVSDANSADVNPINAGSAETFGGVAYVASADGKTITDGDHWAQFINMSPGHSIQDYEGALIIPKNKSIGLSIKPSASTTVCCEIQCWFE